MLGMGWSEILVVGVVALIVVGPKDLPNMFRTIGQFTGKARGMAREFSRAMESAADDAGVKDITRTIKAAGNPAQFGADKLRSATGLSSYKPGGATQALSKERAEAKAKITEATAKAATERKAREAAAATPPDLTKPDTKPGAKTTATPPMSSDSPVAPAADAPKPAARSATKSTKSGTAAKAGDTAAPKASKVPAKKPVASQSAAAKPAMAKPAMAKPKTAKPKTAKATAKTGISSTEAPE